MRRPFLLWEPEGAPRVIKKFSQWGGVMKNARKFDKRITLGGVPDNEDLKKLKELGLQDTYRRAR